ncbi:hypothetical protein R1flu_005298 [Riccia fluitans]|uniref:Uncharacterized protein n=1 Tax=Riccia fluitans TaxID=41844 RepID=A0ABD1YVJ2_9MARC
MKARCDNVRAKSTDLLQNKAEKVSGTAIPPVCDDIRSIPRETSLLIIPTFPFRLPVKPGVSCKLPAAAQRKLLSKLCRWQRMRSRTSKTPRAPETGRTGRVEHPII